MFLIFRIVYIPLPECSVSSSIITTPKGNGAHNLVLILRVLSTYSARTLQIFRHVLPDVYIYIRHVLLDVSANPRDMP